MVVIDTQHEAEAVQDSMSCSHSDIGRTVLPHSILWPRLQSVDVWPAMYIPKEKSDKTQVSISLDFLL